jgi:uncharacterized membrane protein YbhN (UPF0104 family)
MAGQKGIFTGHEKSGIPNVFSENRTAILAIIAITVAICIGAMLISGVRRFLKTLFDKMLRYGKKAIEQSLQAGLVLLRNPFLVVESLGLTFILQSMVIISLWVLGRQMGIPTGWKGYFVFFSVMWIIGSIPISIAGIGIVEGGLIMLFTKFGSASPEAAAALALCQRVAWLIASLPGLAVYLSGKHLPTDFAEQFSVDEKQTIP